MLFSHTWELPELQLYTLILNIGKDTGEGKNISDHSQYPQQGHHLK